ncbi:MAG: gliding motility-associated C-terminal domain-containing protein [Bacteroidota bacterium]
MKKSNIYAIIGNIRIITLLFAASTFLIPANSTAQTGNDLEIIPGFIENKGQVADTEGNLHPGVLFTYDAPNARMFFYNDKIVHAVFRFEKEVTEESIEKRDKGDLAGAEMLELRIRQQRIDLEFVNANPEAGISFLNPGKSKVNYYLSQCPQGVTDLPVYSDVRYDDIYPNVDMIYHSGPSGYKYDLVLKPGAKLSDIRFRYNGADPLQIADGKLIIPNKISTMTEVIPSSYIAETNEPVEAGFLLFEDNTFGFSVRGIEDVVTETLVIDPSLTWSTYYEKSTTGAVSCIRGNNTVDVNGNLFYQINTYSADLPLANPGGSVYYDPSYNPSSGLDIYFAKFDINRDLVWSTYLGGSEGNQSNYYDHGLATQNGYFYICGNTSSNNFPVTNQGGGAYYVGTCPATQCGFLSKFNISTGQMIHSTYLNSYDYHSMAIAPNGNIAVISFNYTWSVTPNVMNRAGAYNQAAHGGDSDIFIYMFNSSLAQIWGTYFGGAGYTDAMGVTFDSNNNLFMFSRSGSTTAMIYANPGGGAYYDNSFQDKYDLGISKFNSSGALVWSTLYGGSGLEGLSYSTIKVNSDNDVIITSTTRSTDIYTYNQGGGAYYDGTAPLGLNNGWGGDPGCGFYARFNNSGVLQHSTYIGVDNESNYIHDQAQGNCNKEYILLSTMAFPVTTLSGSYNVTNATPAQYNYMAIEFDTDFSINWASYLQSDSSYFERFGNDVTNGRLYVTGSTRARDYTTANPGSGAYYDNVINSGTGSSTVNAIMEFNVGGPPSVSVQGGGNPEVCYGGNITLTATGNGTISWYNAPTGGTLLGTGTTYTLNNVTANTTVYVESNDGGCISARIPYTVTVNPAPAVTASATSTTICNGQSTTLNAGGASTYVWNNGLGAGASHIVNPSGTTTYTVTGTNASGCTNTANVTITVNSVSTAPTGLTASSSTICSGSSVTLTNSGGSLGTGASWYLYTGSCGGTLVTSNGTGVFTVSPASTTTYYVMASGTCNSTTCASTTITVNSNSTAPASLTASSSTICSGSSVTLTTSGGSLGTGASWYLYTGSCGGTLVTSNGTGVFTVSPASTTTYYVMASGICNSTTCASVTITVTALPAAAGTITGPVTVCQGDNGITYSIPAISGATSYTWTLPSGFTGSSSTNSITVNIGASASSGSVTVYGSNACGDGTPAVLNVTVSTASTDPTGITASNTTICAGSSTSLTVNGGILGLGADWYWYEGGCGSGSSIGTGSSISVTPSSTTVYYVRAEGACNNTSCVSVVINVTAAPNAGTDGTTSVCEGDPTFNMFSELGGSPSGGGTWTNSGGSAVSNIFDPSTMTSDVFTYTVSGTPPCADASATVTVTVNPLPIVSFTGLDTMYCGGSDPILLTGNHAPDGTFSGTDVNDLGNGTAGYTHATPGVHTVTYTYTDVNGCTASDIQTVTVYALPNVVFAGLDTAYCFGDPAVNIIGNQAPSGIFTGAGVTDNGNGSAVFNPAGVGTANVTYSYTDGNGCTASDIQQVEVYALPGLGSAAIIDVTVCSSPYDGSITVTATGGAGNYLYGINGSALDVINNFPGLNAGGYLITIQDTNGCSMDTMLTVGSNTGFNIDTVEITDLLCFGDSSGQLVIHAPNGTDFSIDNGSTFSNDSSFTGLSGGSYNIIVQDAGNCTDSYVAVINEPTAISLDSLVTNASCGGANGTAAVSASGGTPPYDYLWDDSSTGSSVTNAAPGSYYVTVTDYNGCESTLTLVVGDAGGILATSFTNISNVDCNGNTTGQATVTASGTGSYTYLWSNGDTTATVTGLAAGTYYVTVDDAGGCSGIDTLVITEPNALTFNTVVTHISCYGMSNGAIDLNVTGGTPAYTYIWQGPNSYSSTDSIITGLDNGGYYVTVTDANGCKLFVTEISVTEPASALSVIFTANPPACSGDQNGTAIALASGGTSPYVYSWSNGDLGSNTNNLGDGEYYLTVTDGNFCITIDTLKITAPGTLALVDTITDASCIGNNDGVIQLSVTSGTSPYSFIWSTEPAQDDSTASGLIAGDYFVTITDFNNCETVADYTVADGTGICLIIPTVFTPNVDGKNDHWELPGIELYGEIFIQVFNRWGDLMYEYDGSGAGYADDPWDGTWKGAELPISSYVYIIDLKDGTDPYQGIVTIKK